MESRELSPLERAFRLFTDMRPGEGVTGLVMFGNVFLILCAYYFVKPLRDGWIAVSDIQGLSKMEVKAYTSFGQSFLLVFVVAGYARLAARWPRRTLIRRSTLFCMSNLLVFWCLQPGFLVDYLPGSGIIFYLWVGMFGVFVVAQFWGFAADLYSDERGRRLLPLIAIGATGGAAFGSYLVSPLVSLLGSGTLLLLANVPLAASIALTTIADARGPTGEGKGQAASRAPAAPRSQNRLGALHLVLHHRYLLPVAAITLLTNWVNTNGENLLFRVVQDALATTVAPGALRDATTAFYGDFFKWVNVLALLLQALVASRLLKYGGFGLILLLLPTISLASYTMMAVAPILSVVRVMKIAENSTDYSINNTARHVLWLPTSAEMKYTAKPAIETFFVRLGDGLAALTVLVGVQIYSLSTQGFFLFNVSLVLAWLVASVVVVREHRRLSELAHAAA